MVCFSALFAAFFAVCAWISFPMPSGISLTLQTFGIAFGGYMLGAGWGTAAYAVYLLVGAVGFPVFSAFGSGIGQLLGVTGGYLIGFFGLVALCGAARKINNIPLRLLLGFSGLAVCHLCGILQFSRISGNGFLASAAVATLPYIAKDLISVAAAAFAAQLLLKRQEIAKFFKSK